MDCPGDSRLLLGRRLALAAWLIATVGCGTAATDSASAPDDTTVASTEQAEEIAEKMLARYREARSYTDHAEYVQRSVLRSEGVERELPFFHMSVAFERPNRLRLRFEEAVEGSAGRKGFDVASDGAVVRATAGELAGQVQESAAPGEITVKNFLPDPLIRDVFNSRSLGDVFPQLAMLLNKDDESLVFPDDESPQLLEELTLRGRPCHRLATTSPQGRRILWIDRENYSLLRMELPIEAERSVLDADGRYSQLAVWIDFNDATFDAAVDSESFELKIAEGARRVRRFVAPPPPGPPAELGEPVADFQFKNAEGAPVTPASLRGKTTLLSFWQADCAPCKANMPDLDAVFRELQEDEAFSFYAVSLDGARRGAAATAKLLRDWGGGMPVLFDPKQDAVNKLHVEGTPTLMLLDREGRLQYLHTEQHRDPQGLQETIRRVQRGVDLAAAARAEHRQLTKDYEAELASVAIKESVVEIEVARPAAGERRLPEKFTAAELWTTVAETIARPGNLVALSDQSAGTAAMRWLVVDGGEAVVELNEQGEQIARHLLDAGGTAAGPAGANGFIRVAEGPPGERRYAVSGVGWPQVRVFDEKWAPVLSFPKERPPGIADVQWLDPAYGEARLAVGYWGGVGVQGVGLDGRRRWSERSLEQVVQLTVVPATESAPAELWCTGSRGTILVLDDHGKPQREVEVTGQALMHLAAVHADGATRGCGLALEQVGQYAAVGFDGEGDLEWHYPLPAGEYVRQVERVQHVTLPGGAAAWMIAAPDGAILWLDMEGRLIDQFPIGEPLAGLSLTNSGDGAILVVGGAKAATAWRLSSPQP